MLTCEKIKELGGLKERWVESEWLEVRKREREREKNGRIKRRKWIYNSEFSLKNSHS